MQILFARHGESQANLARRISNRGLVQGLIPTGREQAAALAEQLAGRRIHRIYTSPLLRALETTILVSHQRGVEYEVSDALREFDCGLAEGRSDRQAWLDWQSLVDDWKMRGLWERRIEGGESFNDLQMRFMPLPLCARPAVRADRRIHPVPLPWRVVPDDASAGLMKNG